jgi:hypothetical protein
MKLLYIFLLLLSSFVLKAQSNAFTVTMAGIGDIKLGMKKADFEKLINQTIRLPHLATKNEDYYQDTVHVNYKGLEADVIFQKEYTDENKFNIVIWEVRSNAHQLKTKSGIGIGDDKIRIVTTYPDFTIWLMPEYEKDYTVKSKTKSTVWLHGDSGGVIIFYLENGKITGMSVTYDEGC